MKKNSFSLLLGMSMFFAWGGCKSQKASDDLQTGWTNSLNYYAHSIATGGYGYVFQISLFPDTLDQVYAFDSLSIGGISLPVNRSEAESENKLLLEAHYRYYTEKRPGITNNFKRIGEDEIQSDPSPLLYYHDKNDQSYQYPLNRAKAAGGPSQSP